MSQIPPNIDYNGIKNFKRFIGFKSSGDSSGLYKFITSDTALYKNLVFESTTEDPNNAIIFYRDPVTDEFTLGSTGNRISRIYTDSIDLNSLNLSGPINIGSDLSLTGTLQVSHDATFGGSITVTDHLQVNGSATFVGIMDVDGGMRVYNVAVFNDDVYILPENRLFVDHIRSNNISENHIVIGDLDTRVEFPGGLDIAGGLNVGGVSTFNRRVNFLEDILVSGNIHITGTLTVPLGTVQLTTIESIPPAPGFRSFGGTREADPTTRINIGNDPYTTAISLGNGANVQSINIGNENPNACTINIGNDGSTVNILGSFNYVNVQELIIQDKNITLNASANGEGTSVNSGFYIRDSDTDTKGYILTDPIASEYFLFKAPYSAGTIQTPIIPTEGDQHEFLTQSLITEDTVTVYNNLQVGRNLNVLESATVTDTLTAGTVAVESGLFVTGDSCFENDLTVHGDLHILGDIGLTDGLRVPGYATFQQGLTVITGGIRVSGTSLFHDPVYFDASVSVSGAAAFQSIDVADVSDLNSLRVAQTTTLNRLVQSGSATFQSGLVALNTVTVSGARANIQELNVSGESALNNLIASSLTVSGQSTFYGSVLALTSVVIQSILDTQGIQTNTLAVSGATVMRSSLTVSGAGTILDSLTVSGTSVFQRDLTVPVASRANIYSLNVSGGSTFTSGITVRPTVPANALIWRDGETDALLGTLGHSTNTESGSVHLYSSGLNTVALRSNGDSYLTAGNFGIGTSTPQRRLEVADSVRINGSYPILEFGGDTQNRILYLSSDKSFHFVNNNQDAITIDGTGTAIQNRPFVVSGVDASLAHLNVSGNATFHNINVLGAIQGLSLTGGQTFQSIYVTGESILNDTLTVSGARTNLQELNVSGSATFQNVRILGSIYGLSLTGSQTFQSLNVSGGTTLNGGLFVSGGTTLGDLTILGSLNGLSLTGSQTFASLYVTGSTHLNSSLTVSGTISATDIQSRSGVLNIGCEDGIQRINIGTNANTGSAIINIGGLNDIVNIAGSFNYISVQNVSVADKTFQLNASGTAGSSVGSGIYIQDGEDQSAGFFRIVDSVQRDRWQLKTPGDSGSLWTVPLNGEGDREVVAQRIGGGTTTLYNNLVVTGTTTLSAGLTVDGSLNNIQRGGSIQWNRMDYLDPITRDGGTGGYQRTYVINSQRDVSENGGIVLGEGGTGNGFTANAYFMPNGDMRLRGNFYMISDARLKTDIRVVPDALDKVDRMRGVYYKRIDKDVGRDELGVIAQEVQSVLPEAVDRIGDRLAVNYPALVAVLIEGMKTLREENRELRESIRRINAALGIS